jgi:hypothetical protein
MRTSTPSSRHTTPSAAIAAPSLIIFDAAALVSAALKADSVPERALLRAEEVDVFALSAAVDAEIAEVFDRRRDAARAASARPRKFCGVRLSGLSVKCG